MSQTSISNRIIPLLLLTDGLVSVSITVFAHALGFDSNPVWGRPRIILFAVGLLLIALSLLIFQVNSTFIESDRIKTILVIGHVWAVIFVIYAWFVTFGNFTTWKNSTRYYTQLASAFTEGHLYVDAKPSAKLLAASNPYDPDVDRGVDTELWDMSFYKGKFYLYWGPVPALVLVPLQAVFNRSFADLYLVYFFYCGLLVVNSLIILKLWRLFFEDIPLRYVVLSIFVTGLILPVLWSLNIPDVYEAAIGAGQFFLMGGIYFVILAFEKNIQKKYLFLAGLFWACSVGSRAINVLPILLLVALTLFWIWKNSPKPLPWLDLIRLAASLLTPLAIGAILIGWYNWARFDSPLEFGLRYQITIHDLTKLMPLTFLPDYFLPNLYAYGFQPFEFIEKFPFIQPIAMDTTFRVLGTTPPKIFSSGRLTGLFIYAPFLILAFVALFNIKKYQKKKGGLEYKFIISLLVIAFGVNFLSLLFFFFGRLRYSVDVISPIVLLAVLGYFHVVLARSQLNHLWSKLLLSLANILIIFTMIASILLSFSSENNRMERLNPELMERINSLFVWRE